MQICNMEAFKNRNIFECWMAMRRGIVKGRDWPVAPLYSVSFGPFLAETRKGRYFSVFVSHRATATALTPPTNLPTIMAGSIRGAKPAVNPR